MNLRLPGLSPKAPSMPEPLPPVPTREDPEIVKAKEKLRLSQAQRAGRASSIKTTGLGVVGEPEVERPEARSAKLLGQA